MIYEFTVSAMGKGDDEEGAWEDVWQYLIEKIQQGEYDKATLLDRSLLRNERGVMGADFLWTCVPKFQMTADRRECVREHLRSRSDELLYELADQAGLMPYDEWESESYESEHPNAAKAAAAAAWVRDNVYDAVVDSQQLVDSREVSELCLPGMDYTCLVTGGMSWGDSPTKAFDVFGWVRLDDDLFPLLVSFARKDFAADFVEDTIGEDNV